MNSFTWKPLLLLLLFSICKTNAQDQQKKVLDDLLEFHSTPKEIAYLHLNKSLLLQGEQLGFSAYVITQKEFKPSKETTNLYVQIKDSMNTVVKEKLVLINNGTGASSFNIDSAFTSGSYSITAYTNWMRNFDQQYFFNEKIQVVKSNLSNKIKEIDHLTKIDAQFLPESGHLLKNTLNTLGIVVKDSLGYGLSNAYVRVLNEENKSVGNIRLNQFGIGKITFVPEASEKYTAFINFRGKEFIREIDTKIEGKGVVLGTEFNEHGVEIIIKTNEESLESIGEDDFILSIQNTNNAITYQVRFNEETNIRLPIAFFDLKPGINIVTLFNSDSKPVAERLFFNSKNLDISGVDQPVISERSDSLNFNLPTHKFADSTFLSVSVLPENTIADKRGHNIISYLMLQPHIKGVIENASWYFKQMDENKMQALDNLLITQGWSSYNWEKIFREIDNEPRHQFERYMDIQAFVNDKKNKDKKFLIHASTTNPPTFIDIPEGKDSFIVEDVIPMEEEKLFISRIKRNDALLPAGLAVQFFPSQIEGFDHTAKSLDQKSHLFSGNLNPNFSYFNDFGKGMEQLDEVLIETKIDKVKQRERELGNHAWGKADVMEDDEIMMFNTLGRYLISKGLWVFESPGNFSVTSSQSRPSGFGIKSSGPDPTFEGASRNTSGLAESQGMAIFLDDMPLYDKGMLYQYPLANIDYIEINVTGMGNGFIGSNGSIKIYTKLDISFEASYRNRLQEFEYPVSYALNKEFYIPKYLNKIDSFFQEYGVIDWKSNLTAGINENIQFDIAKPEVDYKLIIEGFTSEGKLIYDVKSITIQ